MKKRMSMLVLALFMTVLTACSTSGAVNSGSVSGTKPASNTSASSSAAPAETADQQAAKQVVLDFFAAAKKEDYKTMKGMCTKKFVKSYFQKSKENEFWWGYKTVTLTDIHLITDDVDNFRKNMFPDTKSGYMIDTSFKGRTVPGSALWAKDTPVMDNGCTFLVQKIDGNWKICDIDAG